MWRVVRVAWCLVISFPVHVLNLLYAPYTITVSVCSWSHGTTATHSLYAHGGIDYRCLHFVGATAAPVRSDNASTCAAKLRELAFNPNATSDNGTVLYGARVAGQGYSDVDVQEAVAVFFLVRRQHFWFGTLARPNMSSAMVANLLLRDYGAPLGSMRELSLQESSSSSRGSASSADDGYGGGSRSSRSSSGDGGGGGSLVFERKYEGATVRLDCHSWTSSFTPRTRSTAVGLRP